MIKRFVVLCFIVVAGCSDSPVSLMMMSDSDLRQQTDAALCNAWSVTKGERIEAEIRNRSLLTEDEFTLARQNLIRVGVSEMALICSFGVPGIYGSINETLTASSVSRQYVYRLSRFGSARFVYVRNGVVTAIQS